MKKTGICKTCGKEFKYTSGKGLFCSKKCFGASIKCEEVTIQCLHCKKDIHTNVKAVERGKKFCSINCLNLYNAENKRCGENKKGKCKLCGEEFEFISVPSRKDKMYCSTDCSNHDRFRKGTTKTTKCQECGKEFKFNSIPSKPNRTFCSKDCQYKSMVKRRIGTKYNRELRRYEKRMD